MLGIYEQNGHRSVSKELLTEDYITVVLNQHDRSVEITDVDDPDYEDPDSRETNEELISKKGVHSLCLLCHKKVYSIAVFAKHVMTHTNANVAAVAETITDVTAAAAIQNENDPDEATAVDDYSSSSFNINEFKASIGWVQKFVKRHGLGT